MADPDRTTPNGLMQALHEQPFAFDFFQAVRRIEAVHPDAPRTGFSQRLSDDSIRFAQEPSLSFAPSTIFDVKLPDPEKPGPPAPRLFVTFLGLMGANGPLPLHLTEHARDRERNHADPTFARFLDIFHHRAISLFCRAWASCQKTVNLERENDPAGDRFALFIAALYGMAMPSQRFRDAAQDSAKGYFAGRLASQTRCAEGLASIIQEYFKVPVDIQQFTGQWLALPADCHLKLGKSPSTGSLGTTAIVGSSIWECQQKFRVTLGPLSLVDYEKMLPSASCRSLKRLRDWVRLYTTDELCWDLKLILKAREVPRISLGKFGRLGWTTWTSSAPESRDRADLTLSPQTIPL